MIKRILYLLMCGSAALLLPAAVSLGSDSTKADNEEKVKHEFVGVKKCKIFHKAQYSSWEATSHAKAWSLLKPEEQNNE